jgi:NADPH:quinone reductase-like Zn-dependent oxidoreductase
VTKPSAISHQEAGVLGLVTTAALSCLEPFDRLDGQTILVNGATGGVGMCLLQIATARGARVIATARPGPEEDHIRRLGAAEVVDWGAGSVGATVEGHYPSGIDGLVDLIAYDPQAVAELAERVLRPYGRVVSALQAANQERLPGYRCANVFASPRPDFLEELRMLVERGILRPVVSEVHDLEGIHRALEVLAGGSLGKVGVWVSSP